MTAIKNFCFAAVLCVVAAGCARYEPEPIAPSRTALALENRTLDEPGLRSFLERNIRLNEPGWPPRSWDFEMLSLAAFYYHPDMEVARADWDVARAGIETAGGRLNPTLNATPELNFSHVNAPAGLSPWLPAVSFDVPVETAGKRGKRIAQAQYVSESARLNIAATAWRVRANVRSSLLDFAAANQRGALLEKQVSIQEQIISLLDKQVQAGALAAPEVVTFRIALQKTRMDLADTRRQAAEARASVAQAIAVPVRALENVEFAYSLTNDAALAGELTTAEMRHEALLGRSDILAALADYAAAESALRLEIAKQYPDVHFSPGYQFDQGDNLWSLGLTVELPVLNQNQGPIAEANARRTASAARFNALQAKVLGDVDAAVEGFHATEQSLSMLGALASEQAKSRDAIEAQVKAGAAAPLDLLNAQLEFAVAESSQQEAGVKLQQSVAALEDAVQRPVESMASAVFEQRPKTNKEMKP